MKISDQQFSVLAYGKLEQWGPNIMIAMPPARLPMTNYNLHTVIRLTILNRDCQYFTELFWLDKKRFLAFFFCMHKNELEKSYYTSAYHEIGYRKGRYQCMFNRLTCSRYIHLPQKMRPVAKFKLVPHNYPHIQWTSPVYYTQTFK